MSKNKNIRRDETFSTDCGGELGLEFSERGIIFTVEERFGGRVEYPRSVWIDLREEGGQEKLKLLISELQQQLMMIG
jgi:hypothetical protein